MVSISACHAEDPGSIPGGGVWAWYAFEEGPGLGVLFGRVLAFEEGPIH